MHKDGNDEYESETDSGHWFTYAVILGIIAACIGVMDLFRVIPLCIEVLASVTMTILVDCGH